MGEFSELFLMELSELCKKYNYSINACKCGPPFLEKIDSEPTKNLYINDEYYKKFGLIRLKGENNE